MATDQIMAGKTMGKRQRVANGEWRMVGANGSLPWSRTVGVAISRDGNQPRRENGSD